MSYIPCAKCYSECGLTAALHRGTKILWCMLPRRVGLRIKTRNEESFNTIDVAMRKPILIIMDGHQSIRNQKLKKCLSIC